MGNFLLLGTVALTLFLPAVSAVAQQSWTTVLEDDFECATCSQNLKWANYCQNTKSWKAAGLHLASCEFSGTDINGQGWSGCGASDYLPDDASGNKGCMSIRGSSSQRQFPLGAFTRQLKVEFDFTAQIDSDKDLNLEYSVEYEGGVDHNGNPVVMNNGYSAATFPNNKYTLGFDGQLDPAHFSDYTYVRKNGRFNVFKAKFTGYFDVPEGPQSGCGKSAFLRIGGDFGGGQRFYVYDLKVSAMDQAAGSSTCAATGNLNAQGGGNGDPHLKTWNGHKYDYHGECDMVLVDNPHFADGLGLKLHIRTTRVKHYSYIERAALKIGSDVLEFANDVNTFTINGKAPSREAKNLLMADRFHVNRLRIAVSVRLDESAKAKIDFHQRKNGMMWVNVDSGSNPNLFPKSLGLIGQYESGEMLGRDNSTTFAGEHRINDFANEWQVRGDLDGPLLFQEARAPQHPQKCLPPKPKTLGSRLGASRAKAKAEKVCAAWKEEDRQDCIFDVIHTRDEESAEEPFDVEYHVDFRKAPYQDVISFVRYLEKKAGPSHHHHPQAQAH